MKKDVAVKFDKEGESLILTECLFLKEQRDHLKKSVKYLLHDTVNARRFMVMEYLEQSVEEYLETFKDDHTKYFEEVKALSI